MFKINIEDRTVNTLFDTGATRSVMSANTFKILKLKDKDLITKKHPPSSRHKWDKFRSNWPSYM